MIMENLIDIVDLFINSGILLVPIMLFKTKDIFTSKIKMTVAIVAILSMAAEL